MVLAEGLLSLFFPIRSQIYRLEKQLLYGLIPGASKLHITENGKHSHLRINNLGYRGDDIPEKKQKFRIAIYGDSMVFANTVDQEDTFVRKLAGLTARPVEVLNGGVVGYGPDQAILRMERDFERIKPDLAMLCLCANNDFGDLIRNKIFWWDPKQGLVQNGSVFPGPELKADFKRADEESERFCLFRVFHHFKESRQRARTKQAMMEQSLDFIGLYLQAAQTEFQEYKNRANPLVNGAFYDYYDADMAIRPDSEMGRYKWKLLREVLKRANGFCKNARTPFVVLVTPSAVDLCETFNIRVDPEQYPSYAPSKITSLMSRILKEEQIPYLDLYPPLLKQNPDSCFEGQEDFHFNEKGHEFTARLLAEFLELYIK